MNSKARTVQKNHLFKHDQQTWDDQTWPSVCVLFRLMESMVFFSFLSWLCMCDGSRVVFFLRKWMILR